MIIPFFTDGQEIFNKYFTNKSLRFDFLLAGDAEQIQVFPAQMKQEPFWAGSHKNLTDTFNYGTYRFRVLDFNSGSLLFLKGFSTLFQEWQSTAEAKTTTKTFYQAVIFPYPKQKVKLEIDARHWDSNFETIYSTVIDPKDYFILNESSPPFKSFDIFKNGKPENKVDIVILAEGYTVDEMGKFTEDARRVTNYLFEEEPFKSEKNKFNVRALFTPSLESGTDIPGEEVYKNTFFNSNFYTFDVPRYLTTTDMKNVYDAASNVPYDHIYVLVNTEKYGGGGFYNFLSVCSADNDRTKTVFTHEFGHGFAGLGDEYYTSEVAYENYYNLEIEPWEPNLTTLVDFEAKWKAEIDKSIPAPTPRNPEYTTAVGAFEGGGYIEKGIYSPFMDCRMKSNTAGGFCPVCKDAIKKVIDFYTK
jgi:hypothetical protein